MKGAFLHHTVEQLNEQGNQRCKKIVATLQDLVKVQRDYAEALSKVVESTTSNTLSLIYSTADGSAVTLPVTASDTSSHTSSDTLTDTRTDTPASPANPTTTTIPTAWNSCLLHLQRSVVDQRQQVQNLSSQVQKLEDYRKEEKKDRKRIVEQYSVSLSDLNKTKQCVKATESKWLKACKQAEDSFTRRKKKSNGADASQLKKLRQSCDEALDLVVEERHAYEKMGAIYCAQQDDFESLTEALLNALQDKEERRISKIQTLLHDFFELCSNGVVTSSVEWFLKCCMTTKFMKRSGQIQATSLAYADGNKMNGNKMNEGWPYPPFVLVETTGTELLGALRAHSNTVQRLGDLVQRGETKGGVSAGSDLDKQGPSAKEIHERWKNRNSVGNRLEKHRSRNNKGQKEKEGEGEGDGVENKRSNMESNMESDMESNAKQAKKKKKKQQPPPMLKKPSVRAAMSLAQPTEEGLEEKIDEEESKSSALSPACLLGTGETEELIHKQIHESSTTRLRAMTPEDEPPIAYVVHSYEANGEDELTINVETVLVSVESSPENDEGWCLCTTNKGAVGLVPRNHIKII